MRVYIHGNCQASAIGWLLQEVRPDWTITSREVHTFDIASPAAFEAYIADVASADLILAQPISENYRGVDYLSLAWLKAQKPPGATLLVFPSIFFRGYAQQSFALGQPGHLMEYHDVHVADMYRSGVPAAECHERIASEGFFTRGFVLGEVMEGLRELIRREEAYATHARVSPILARDLERALLFHTFNHPARAVLVEVTEQLMAAADAPVTLARVGMDYLNKDRIMPYRSAVLHLGMDPAVLPELGCIVRSHVSETLLEYVRAVYESYDTIGPEAVSAALSRSGEASAYLARFRGSVATRPAGFDASAHIHDLYALLLRRQPSPAEVQYWVRSLGEIGLTETLRQFLASPEYAELTAKGALGLSGAELGPRMVRR